MKYGDYDNVPRDSKVVYSVINNQGSDLVIECLAEHLATSLQKFKCTDEEKLRAMNSMILELKESILERI